MCTVSYVPLAKGYVLTSNRDENPMRKTKLPNKMRLENGITIYSPIDVLKGGTWIAMDEKGRSACLLNGAFLKHKTEPNYRRSRGQFVIEAFKANDFKSFLQSVFLENIEPFTLLLIEPDDIQKLVWDGTTKYTSHFQTTESHLWSSATLYDAVEHHNKEVYFLEALRRNGNDTNQILEIHGKDLVTPFILKHATLETVSITQIVYNGQKSSLEYILKDNTNETSNSLSLICH